MNIYRIRTSSKLFPALLLLFIFIIPIPAHAHHLGVFAYVNDRDIVVTASFGHNRPVVNGKVTVTNSAGKLLFQGKTDSRGMLHFPRPQLPPNETVKITVSGGPGHQGVWTMTPADLGNDIDAPETPADSVHTAQPNNSPSPSSLSADEQRYLARLVSMAVAREIEPLKAMMARQMDSGPSLQNIIGGIGWLVGIGGLVAAWSSRKKQR